MKLHLIYLTLCSLTQAAYISRMALITPNNLISPTHRQNNIRTSAFRPGVMLRPWNPRLVQAASHRMPYVVYRNSPQRYSVKHYTPTRMVTSPWKAATRPPTVTAGTPANTEYEFVRTASTPHKTHAESGAIHTIPAPNLSLSEKPIVVLEDNNNHNNNGHSNNHNNGHSNNHNNGHSNNHNNGHSNNQNNGHSNNQNNGHNNNHNNGHKNSYNNGFYNNGHNNDHNNGYNNDHNNGYNNNPNNGHSSGSVSTETPKLYEVTEKFQDPTILHVAAKIEQPIGFSKNPTLSQPDFQSLVRNGAQLQLSDFGFPGLSLPQTSIQQPIIHHHHHQAPVVTQQSLPQQHSFAQSILPQQFSLHNFQTLPNAQEFVQSAPDGMIITPNALLQPDPEFLKKLQNQLLQRFPGVEFVPYAAGFAPASNQRPQYQIQNQISFQPSHNNQQSYIEPQPQQSQTQIQTLTSFLPAQSQPQNHVTTVQPQSQPPPPFFLLQNEQYAKFTPQTFAVAETQNLRNVVQRETQEGTVVTLVPQVVTNATDKLVEVTSITTPQNVTLEFVTTETKPDTTTIRYVIETTTEEQKTTPVPNTPVTRSVTTAQVVQEVNPPHEAQASQIVSQSVQANQSTVQANQNVASVGNVQIAESAGNVVTDSFYSAINDVRAAAVLAQDEKSKEHNVSQENMTTTTSIPTSTINPDLKPYFVKKPEKDKENQTVTEIKPVLGVPFAKSQNSVAYTLLRSDDKEAKVAKDGSVYAGQIVEASVSEDPDFHKQKASLFTRRAPIRLVAVAENKDANITTTTQRPQRGNVVRARIPPKSKLTFDDKTGEPVLRIYASYVDSPAQKEALASKLSNTKQAKEIPPRKRDTLESFKAGSIKALAKPHGFEPSNNQVNQFGLKMRSRSDDYVALFDDNED